MEAPIKDKKRETKNLKLRSDVPELTKYQAKGYVFGKEQFLKRNKENSKDIS